MRELLEEKTIIVFGIGVNFRSYIERLDTICKVSYFSDNDKSKVDSCPMGDDRRCINPQDILRIDNPFVIIAAERESAKLAIENQLDSMNLKHERIGVVLNNYSHLLNTVSWPQTIQDNRIHKFIELLVHGTTECNFHCDYCYVWRKEDFHNGIIASEYSPKHIREALSKKRLGGICHINMCALGETLIAQNIEDIVFELASEGHYISIITNGTVSNKIDKILSFSDEVKERIFFKLSFHYEELNRTGLMQRFWDNVRKIKESSCSYSIEITPSDRIIDKVEEIKEVFRTHAESAMPHITFTRDATKEGLDLYSDLSLQEYIDFWKQFDSKLFDLKSRLYKKKIHENCYAGYWSYRVNLVNGNIQSCYKQDIKESIFSDIEKPLPLLTVKNHCAMDYCFNNHAFISWGDVPEIECETYLELRDRTDSLGNSWVKGPYRYIMSQKLYENNFQYIDKWNDYEKLCEADRAPAFILFNSPEYGNLGDHAIAYAEKEYFKSLFPNRDFIEISAKQYISDNLNIKNYIKKEDVLLLTGGGYLGSVWPWLEDLSLNIIENYPDNKIIILPQTVYFDNTPFGESEKQLFCNVVKKHRNIALCARDNKTYNILKSIIPEVKIIKTSDMVVGLNLKKYANNTECNNVLVCLREDKESDINISDYIREIKRIRGDNIKKITTVVDKDILLNDREKELEKIWSEISNADVMITDRLHASIFACLLNVACICIDNKTGKVEDFALSQQENSKIRICNDVSELTDLLRWALNNKDVCNCVNADYSELEEYLRGDCFAK